MGRGAAAIFLDVDGTLVNARGMVPDSARRAVRRARANGHRVFLCTGRSPSQLWPEILDIGFDGLVAAAGGFVETGGTVVAHHPIPTEHVRRVVDFFDAREVAYLLESNDGLFGSPGVGDRLRERIVGAGANEDERAELARGTGRFVDAIAVGGDPASIGVNKISFLDSQLTLAEIKAEFGDVFDVIQATVPVEGSVSGELSLRGVHKAAGIEVLIAHLGIDRQDTMAIGDGYNDLEMLEHVALGIAMGDAPMLVRQVADDVTGTPDEDGIHRAFSKYGLL